jgi:hypothetical protein
MIIVGILIAIVSYFIWSYIHEMSHVLAAKCTVGVTDYEIKIFPNKHPVTREWRWASYQCWFKREPTPDEQAIISLAPRIPNFIAVIAFMFATLMNGWLLLIWAIFWGAGLVDLFVGSLGISEHSDLRKAATSLECSPWVLRFVGFFAILAFTVPIIVSLF